MSSGGWGEGKMKARGKRWEGKKSEREPYPPNATYLQSSSEIRRHRDRIIWQRLPPFPSSHRYYYCYFYWNIQREALRRRELRKVGFRAGFRNGLATHSSTRKQVTTTSPNSKRNILTIFLILQRLLF